MSAKIGTGDDGTTSLYDGQRVSKNDPIMEAVGSIDEVQSVLGMILSEDLEQETRNILSHIPHMLFDISGEIASKGVFTASNVTKEESEKMTQWIHFFDDNLPPLQDFMLPSGVTSSGLLNLSRAIARRAERRTFPLLKEGVRHDVFIFLNRLSRLLFSLERWENFKKNGQEQKWEKGRVLPEV